MFGAGSADINYFMIGGLVIDVSYYDYYSYHYFRIIITMILLEVVAEVNNVVRIS